MDAPPELVCERHQRPTRLSCAECFTPICPDCAIKTPVGFKCPDHATAPGRRRRAPNQRATAAIVVAAAVIGFVAIRHFSVAKPVKAACPTEPGPDVGIGPHGGGTNWTEMARSPLCGRFGASVAWTGKDLLVWGGQNCAGSTCPLDSAPRLADGAAYDPVHDTWSKLPKSPLAARDKAATVWTGRELLVWGGTTQDRPVATGAAYNPSTKTWRMLAPSPLSPRADASAVWTGREMIVWGGSDTADGAAYDPSTNRWRTIAASPLSHRAGAVAAWTGSEMVIWSGAPTDADLGLSDGAAYDPSTNRWRTIAPAPIAGRLVASTAWTGQELLIWGGNSGQPDVFADGAAYKPSTDTWRVLPPAPVTARAGSLSVWTGTEMAFWGGLGPADATAPAPTGGPAGLSGAAAPDVGPGTIVPLGDGAAYNPTTNSWRRLERVTLLARGYALGAWDGHGLIVWGGLVSVDFPASAADGARYTP